MTVVETDLAQLWSRVISDVEIDTPQHRAFLSLTKPLGLLKGNGATNFLVAAPNAFAKDVLETRLRSVVSDVLSRELGEKTNIAVTIDENLEIIETPLPEVEIDFVPPRLIGGRVENTTSKSFSHDRCGFDN